ncbi:MAG: Ldh family oxidoreductase, partial [Bacteroidales bacterium]
MNYTPNQLKSFLESVFTKMDFPIEDAKFIAEVLLRAELRNIPSHGFERIKDYYNMWKEGRINANPKVKIVHETPSTALVDGDKAIGMVAARYAMNLCLDKAETAGSAWVSVRNSNHFSIAGYYAMMALDRDMIGITMTNANPFVAPTFSLDRLLGTNPIAIAVPAGEEAPFVADMATTPIARGKLSIMEKKGEKVIEGFVQDEHGNPTTDPTAIKRGGAI